jgi:hypothetical protein
MIASPQKDSLTCSPPSISGQFLCRVFCVAIAVPWLLLAPCRAAEPRDKQWLVDYVRQPIADTPRNRAYLAKIDAAKLDGLLDADWLDHGEDGLPARGQATFTGQLAFAYQTPGTRWHRDPRLLEQVRQALRGFAKHLTAEGRFVWPKPAHPYEHQAHEHVWRLEPLLLAYVWVERDLTSDERREYLAMLKQAGGYLLTHPLTEANNRGVVWCAGALLCGLYFDDPRYFELSQKHAPQILDGVLARQGQVIETQGGGGPDANYSYVGWSYAYLYRLLSGDEALDDRMIAATRWLVCYASLGGDILASGSATRKPDEHAGVVTVLPALERYSAAEPFFARVADQYLAAGDSDNFGRGGVIVSPFIWAMLEKRGAEPSREMPLWYRGHTEIYEWPSVHYLLANRASHQTGISFRANFPLRGLQAFAWQSEPAIVQHTGRDLRVRSFALADGIDTSKENVARGPGGWEIHMTQGTPSTAWNGVAPVTIITRQKTLWTCYAFTPSSTVVVYGGAKDGITANWAMNGVPDPQLDRALHVVSTTGRSGRIHYLSGEPALGLSDGVPVFRLSTTAGPSITAFSDAQFRFDRYDEVSYTLTYHDRSGTFRLSLAGILDGGGDLNRTVPNRLEIFADE